MSIATNIREQLKLAMKEKNQDALDTFRSVISAFTSELVASGKTPQDEVTDEIAQKVIQKIIKQRQDSISQFEAGGRNDLAEIEKSQLAFLLPFMPVQMSEDKIREIVLAKKEALNFTDKTKMGMLVGAVMKEVGASADGAVVKKIVEESFS
ncbi:MAG: uncharacterized protein QG674_353 [Patescibacteria group bacterium]|nr:uncharacterized protein [Patescibacteria group bacterium]